MSRFQIKCFEEEAVVFDAASGDTHYLSPLVYALYTIRRVEPQMALSDIPVRLAHVFDVEADAHFKQLIHDAIASLQQIGLLNTA